MTLRCTKIDQLCLRRRELVYKNTFTITSSISHETGPEVMNVNKQTVPVKQVTRKSDVGKTVQYRTEFPWSVQAAYSLAQNLGQYAQQNEGRT